MPSNLHLEIAIAGLTSAYKTCLTRSHIRHAFTAGFSVRGPAWSNPGGAFLLPKRLQVRLSLGLSRLAGFLKCELPNGQACLISSEWSGFWYQRALADVARSPWSLLLRTRPSSLLSLRTV